MISIHICGTLPETNEKFILYRLLRNSVTQTTMPFDSDSSKTDHSWIKKVHIFNCWEKHASLDQCSGRKEHISFIFRCGFIIQLFLLLLICNEISAINSNYRNWVNPFLKNNKGEKMQNYYANADYYTCFIGVLFLLKLKRKNIQ